MEIENKAKIFIIKTFIYFVSTTKKNSELRFIVNYKYRIFFLFPYKLVIPEKRFHVLCAHTHIQCFKTNLKLFPRFSATKQNQREISSQLIYVNK